MITDRDRRVLNHIERYKYATIEQIQKIFFQRQQNGYVIARRRLGVMRKAGYLKSERNIDNNKLVYMINDRSVKMPGRHRLILLDLLSQLHYIGCDVKLFEVEKQWLNGKIRSDAFTIFTLDNANVKNRYHYFVEIHLSNNDYNLNKYDTLFESGEVQKYLGKDIFPRIMLVTDNIPKSINIKHGKVVILNTKLESFPTVVLPY